jgi:hypothetical protein
MKIKSFALAVAGAFAAVSASVLEFEDDVGSCKITKNLSTLDLSTGCCISDECTVVAADRATAIESVVAGLTATVADMNATIHANIYVLAAANAAANTKIDTLQDNIDHLETRVYTVETATPAPTPPATPAPVVCAKPSFTNNFPQGWETVGDSSFDQTVSGGTMTVTNAALRGGSGWIYDSDCSAAQSATNTFRVEVPIGTDDFSLSAPIGWRSPSGGDVFGGYIAVARADGSLVAFAGPCDPSSAFSGIRRAVLGGSSCDNYGDNEDNYGKGFGDQTAEHMDSFQLDDATYTITRTAGTLAVLIDGQTIFSKASSADIKYIEVLANHHHTHSVYGFGTIIFGEIELAIGGSQCQ